jgi:hypothetical protein
MAVQMTPTPHLHPGEAPRSAQVTPDDRGRVGEPRENASYRAEEQRIRKILAYWYPKGRLPMLYIKPVIGCQYTHPEHVICGIRSSMKNGMPQG